MIPLGVLASRRAAAGGGLSRSYLAFYGDAADRAEYTFASAALGTASASRTIVVAVVYRNVSTNAPSAVTIGGVSASIAVASGGQNGVAIVSAAVPTGSTGDIVVTFPSTSVRCGVAVWEVDGLVAVVDTDSYTSVTSVRDWSTSVNTTAGGLMFGASFTGAASEISPAWTGVAQDNGGLLENIRYGVASDTTSGGSESVGIDYTGTGGTTIRSVAFVSYEPA